MKEGKKVRVKVRTIYTTFTGDLFIPEIRNRLSDVINEHGLSFINLSLVEVEGSPGKIEQLTLNKYLIESIESLEP